MKTNAKNNAIKRSVLIALIVILSLILVILIVGSVFLNSTLGKLERSDPQVTLSQDQIDAVLNETEETVPDFTGEVLSGDEVEMQETPVETIDMGDDIINIMLVGQDTHNLTERSRTDSMILCTVNKTTKTLTMTSFMRDSYLKIPGYLNQRLNVAYYLGGFEALYGALEHNFGVHIEHGVAVNYGSFAQVIDAIDGVEVELTEREANHLNSRNYKLSLTEGVNLLYGEEALDYARIRALDSDFVRTNRQRTILMAAIEKVKTLPVSELYDLIDTFIPLVVTDMSNPEILKIAMELIPLLDDLTIVSQRIPADDTYRMTMVDEMSVLLVDVEANRALLADALEGK